MTVVDLLHVTASGGAGTCRRFRIVYKL